MARSSQGRLRGRSSASVMAGDLETARAWNDRLGDLHKALFLDNSPSPAKFALSQLGLCGEEVRLPLGQTREDVRPAIVAAMARAGVQ